jgi:hypothetical protein
VYGPVNTPANGVERVLVTIADWILPRTDEVPSHFHALVSVAGGGGVPAIVQLAKRNREDVRSRVDRARIETYLVDVESGEGILLESEIPRIRTISEDKVVFLEVDPFPRVIVEELPSQGEPPC